MDKQISWIWGFGVGRQQRNKLAEQNLDGKEAIKSVTALIGQSWSLCGATGHIESANEITAQPQVCGPSV